jgi:hypothetical protein
MLLFLKYHHCLLLLLNSYQDLGSIHSFQFKYSIRFHSQQKGVKGVHMHACTHTYVCTCRHAHACTILHAVHECACICACMHARLRLHTHTHDLDFFLRPQPFGPYQWLTCPHLNLEVPFPHPNHWLSLDASETLRTRQR